MYFLSLRDERLEGSVRYRRWDRPFFLPSLLTFGTLCRDDCCVTTLVPTGSILLFMPFLYLRDELLGVLTPLCRHFYFFLCYLIGIRAEKLATKTPLLFGNFLLIRCFHLVIS